MSDDINKSIGNRIKVRRMQLNITQNELADRLNLKNRSTITRYEQGDKTFKQSQIIALAKALNTTPAYLMGWDDEVEVATKDNLKLLCDMLDKYKLSINSFTDDEIEKIAEYALFLISKRKE